VPWLISFSLDREAEREMRPCDCDRTSCQFLRLAPHCSNVDLPATDRQRAIRDITFACRHHRDFIAVFWASGYSNTYLRYLRESSRRCRRGQWHRAEHDDIIQSTQDKRTLVYHSRFSSRRVRYIHVLITRSNQTMKPTSPFRDKFSVFATTPCRGLSLSR
jgi:hypothetical protein